jgi:hypothetical protein
VDFTFDVARARLGQYALWTVNSFNLLLSGDFEQLNTFVMDTWANDIAVGINQVKPEKKQHTVDHHTATKIVQGWPNLRDLAQHFD